MRPAASRSIRPSRLRANGPSCASMSGSSRPLWVFILIAISAFVRLPLIATNLADFVRHGKPAEHTRHDRALASPVAAAAGRVAAAAGRLAMDFSARQLLRRSPARPARQRADPAELLARDVEI